MDQNIAACVATAACADHPRQGSAGGGRKPRLNREEIRGVRHPVHRGDPPCLSRPAGLDRRHAAQHQRCHHVRRQWRLTSHGETFPGIPRADRRRTRGVKVDRGLTPLCVPALRRRSRKGWTVWRSGWRSIVNRALASPNGGQRVHIVGDRLPTAICPGGQRLRSHALRFDLPAGPNSADRRAGSSERWEPWHRQVCQVTRATLETVFEALYRADVLLEGILLKPNMVNQAPPHPTSRERETVAAAHTRLSTAGSVPAAVPGVVFLSGGQTPDAATRRSRRDNPSWWQNTALARELLLRACSATRGVGGLARRCGQPRQAQAAFRHVSASCRRCGPW